MANKQFNTYEIVGASGSASTDLNGTLKLTNSIKGIDPSGIIGASYAKYNVGAQQVFTFTLGGVATTVGTEHKISFTTDEDDNGQSKRYSYSHTAIAGALSIALIIDALDAKIQADPNYAKFPFVVTSTTGTTLVLTFSECERLTKIDGEIGALTGGYSDSSGAITLSGAVETSRAKPVGHPTIMQRLKDTSGVRFVGSPGTVGTAKYSELSITHKAKSTSGAPHGEELVKKDVLFLLQVNPDSLVVETEIITKSTLCGAINSAIIQGGGSGEVDLEVSSQGGNDIVVMAAIAGAVDFKTTIRAGLKHLSVTSGGSSRMIYLDSDSFPLGSEIIVTHGGTGSRLTPTDSGVTVNTEATSAAYGVLTASVTTSWKKMTASKWTKTGSWT